MSKDHICRKLSVKLCCLGQAVLKWVTTGRSSSETAVLQGHCGFMLFGNISCFGDIDSDLLNMRSIKTERFYICLPSKKSIPVTIILKQKVLQTLIFLNFGGLIFSFPSLTFLIHNIWKSNSQNRYTSPLSLLLSNATYSEFLCSAMKTFILS